MSLEPKKKKKKQLDAPSKKKKIRIKTSHSKNNSNKKNQRKKTSQKNLIKYVVIICLLVFIAIAGGYYYYHQQDSGEEQAVVAGDFLPNGKDAKQMSEKELEKYAQQKADDSQFNMVISPNGEINLTDKSGTVQIQNPTTNSYPISVDLIDDQTSQVIYKSGSILPGQEVKTIEPESGLNLPEGDRKTTAVFSIYDPVSKEKQGEVNAEVILSVAK